MPSKPYKQEACFPKANAVTATRFVPKFGKPKTQTAKSPHQIHVDKGIMVLLDEKWSPVIFGKKKGVVSLDAMTLPSIHKILIPLYAILGIFGFVLIADLPYATTPSGFYQLIGDFGPFLTVAVAIIYLWTVFRKMQE